MIALAAEFVFFWSQSENFMTTSNIELVLVQISAVAVVAAPVGLLLLSGYIDFAVGSTAGLAGAVMGLYLDEQGGSPAIGVLIAIAVGAGVGAVQGTFVHEAHALADHHHARLLHRRARSRVRRQRWRR